MTDFVTIAPPPPMFPSAITIGEASIKLYADGTWSGDADAFEAALRAATQTGEGLTMPIAWLAMNSIRNSR